MTTLVVQRRGATIAQSGNAIVVRRGRQQLDKRPIDSLERLLVYGDTAITGDARNALLANGVAVSFFDWRGQYTGALCSVVSRWSARRQRQAVALHASALQVAVGQMVVSTKVRAQRELIERANRNHPDIELKRTADVLRYAERKTSRHHELDALRGLEGHAARSYFRGLGRALRHPEIQFERRTRRPPRDPANACLSFGYALLLSECVSAIHAEQLDPNIGALHSNLRGAPAFALDVMEPFRINVVDKLVLRLLNRRQLGPNDFGAPPVEAHALTDPTGVPSGDESAVYLGPTGRRVFFAEWSALWRDDQVRSRIRSHVRALESCWVGLGEAPEPTTIDKR